jgi:hypothetical protein
VPSRGGDAGVLTDIDRHGWDVAEDESAWRRYQRRRTAEEYRDDEW